MVKINIDTKVENVLLKRTEIIFTYLHSKQGTPTRISIRDAIAAQTGASGETVYIVNLTTNTGSNETKGRAHVYKVEADARKIEPKYIQLRNYPKKKPSTIETVPDEPRKDEKPPAEKAPETPKKDEKPAVKEAPKSPGKDEKPPAEKAPKQPKENKK